MCYVKVVKKAFSSCLWGAAGPVVDKATLSFKDSLRGSWIPTRIPATPIPAPSKCHTSLHFLSLHIPPLENQVPLLFKSLKASDLAVFYSTLICLVSWLLCVKIGLSALYSFYVTHSQKLIHLIGKPRIGIDVVGRKKWAIIEHFHIKCVFGTLLIGYCHTHNSLRKLVRIPDDGKWFPWCHSSQELNMVSGSQKSVFLQESLPHPLPTHHALPWPLGFQCPTGWGSMTEKTTGGV
jgi:hypothetical protein